MKSIKLMCAAALIAGAMGTPAVAQMAKEGMMKKPGMMSSSHMKMSSSNKRMMAKCSGMSHRMMMKNHGCMKMMKMHPNMMKGH